MPNYFIRLQELDGYEEALKQMVLDGLNVTNVLAVRHSGKNGDNYHFHLYLNNCDLKQQCLRKRFLKEFTKGKGNKHISIKVADESKKPLSYMFHEHKRESFRIIVNEGYTDEEIEGFKSTTETIQNTIKENNPKQMIQDVYERVLSATDKIKIEHDYCPSWGTKQYEASPTSPFAIGMYILEWYDERREITNYYLPNKHALGRYVQQIRYMYECARENNRAPRKYFQDLCSFLLD